MKKLIVLILGLCLFAQAAEQKVHRQSMANSDVYVISLQKSEVNTGILLPQNDAQKTIIKAARIPKNNQNIILVKNPAFIALIDTGFPHNQAILKEYLSGLGISFSDITHVIISHAHGDHVGGILNENGENNFPNATLLIDENDFNYAQTQKDDVKNAINIFSKREFFDHNKAILANELEIFALAAYGHTPGHNILLLQGGGEKLAFWADLLHIYHIQKDNPEISVMYDANPNEAAQSRAKFIKEFRGDKTPVVGAHMPFLKPQIID